MVQVLKYLLPYLFPPKKYDVESFKKEIASLKLKTTDSSESDGYAYYQKNYPKPYSKNSNAKDYKETVGEVFEFDPNTLNEEGWRRLGIKDRTIQTIQKYLSKGGHFYKAEDLEKIWGIHPKQLEKLMPYVRIAKREYAQNDRSPPFEKKTYPPRERIIVNINSADSTAYESLPGIGPKLASRIVSFRNRLGGFVKLEQLSETFGLPDSTYQKIKPYLSFDGGNVKQLNLNSASLEELKFHPYIRYHVANAIVEYRKQHGDYKNIADLRKIMIISDSLYDRIRPYVNL